MEPGGSPHGLLGSLRGLLGSLWVSGGTEGGPGTVTVPAGQGDSGSAPRPGVQPREGKLRHRGSQSLEGPPVSGVPGGVQG